MQTLSNRGRGGLVAARENPFRAERMEALRFRLGEAGWAELLARWASRCGRGAIVGPEGSGKTTLLLELAARLEAAGWEVKLLWADGEPRLSRAQFDGWLGEVRGSGAVFGVDGADRLSAWRWWRLRLATRGAAGLITTQHRVRRLDTLYRCATDPGLLRELVGELVGARAAGERVRTGDGELDRLFIACGGDVRRALRALYDRWAGGVWASGGEEEAGWKPAPN